MSALDLVIVGAGSAGAALAAFTAEAGMRTLVLERTTLDRAGASWINDVPGWMFDAAGVARPTGDAVHASGSLTMIGGFGDDAPFLRAHPSDFLGVDMRALVASLAARAIEAGATLRERTRVEAIDDDGGTLRVRTSAGEHRARFVVDASGLAGLGALGPLHGSARDVCTAAQEVRTLRDAAAARAFFDRWGAREGDVLVFTGVAGGYSIVNVRFHGERVFLLTGSIAAEGHPAGKALIDDFAARHAWVGERVSGGARAIPLAYPRPIVARGSIASVGDAASQVFSAHGSGTGAGLVAARLASEALVAGRLDDYQQRYQRQYGRLFATHDLFRRFKQSLDAAALRVMIGEQILSPASVEAALAQRFPTPDRALLAAGPRLLRHPALARRLAVLGARSARIAAIYAAQPVDPARQDAWAARVAAAMA